MIREGKVRDPSADTQWETVGGSSSHFVVSVSLRLVPKFSEKDLDTFFMLFERFAKNRKWSDSEQTLLLQCVLTGKAQLILLSALSTADSENFQKVKNVVLKAYELVPEAYRQKFRGARKYDKQTYVEFARELSTLFGRWRLLSEVHTFEKLCELLLLEQFQDTLPECIATYLSERNAKMLTEAATIADEYALTHKLRVTDTETFLGHQKGSSSEFQPFKPGNSGSKLDPSRVCNYCLGKGHWKAERPVLKSKQKSQQGYRHVKPVALSAPVRLAEKANAIAAVRRHTKSNRGCSCLPSC